jgi:DNA-binding YbaB/EbfC family protein
MSGPGDQAEGLGGLFASAQEALTAQAEAATQVVEGSAGGGVVTVTMTGQGEVTSVTLAPAVVDPDDIEMLQDLIVAALHDAGLKVTELQRQAMGAFGGVDLGTLGEMLGGLMGGGTDDAADDEDADPSGVAGGAAARGLLDEDADDEATGAGGGPAPTGESAGGDDGGVTDAGGGAAGDR